MEDLYKQIKTELKKYQDKVFYLPLTTTRLSKIEKKYGLEFPKSYRKFLTEFGFIQDFTSIQQTEDSICDHLDFIKDRFSAYFPIGVIEDYDKLYMIDKNDGEMIFEIPYEDEETEIAEMKLVFSGFDSYLNAELQKFINEIDIKTNNDNKVIQSEFSIHTTNFNHIVKLLNQKYKCKWVDQKWKAKYQPVSILKLEHAIIALDNKHIFVEKDYSDADLIFRFELEEPLNEVDTQSKADEIKDLFDENMVNYTVLDSGLLENESDSDDFDDE